MEQRMLWDPRKEEAVGRVKLYREICGFAETGDVADRFLPVLYPTVVSGSMAMIALTAKQWPFPITALPVHVRQVVDIFRHPCKKTPIQFVGRCAGIDQADKGLEVKLEMEAIQGGEVVIRSMLVGLLPGLGVVNKKRRERPRPIARSLEVLREGFPVTRVFACPKNNGWNYAAASGDYNPIHLFDAFGKLSGFKGAIAHGLWTMARAISALEEASVAPWLDLADGSAPSHVIGHRITTRFKRPLLPGNRVVLASRERAEPCDGHFSDPDQPRTGTKLREFTMVSPDVKVAYLTGCVYELRQ